MIKYRTDAWLVQHFFRWRGSVIPYSLAIAIVPALFCVALMVVNESIPELEEVSQSKTAAKGLIWSVLTAALGFVIGFRTQKGYDRFYQGATLCRQMKGEWFDAVSCLIAFTSVSKKKSPSEVAIFRHLIVRLMSLCHGSALEEIQGENVDGGFKYLDMGGLDQPTLRYLRDCKTSLRFNRVEVLIHMMQTLIVHYHDLGVIAIPPPILSRVFQTLSRGQVHLMNCKKIKSTLFPFIYAHLIYILLSVFLFVTPWIMSVVVKRKHWGFLFTLLPTFGLVSLNKAAEMTEIPFGSRASDLPLHYFQADMNISMLMLMREENDHVAEASGRCDYSFNGMMTKTDTTRVRHFVDEEEQRVSQASRTSRRSVRHHRTVGEF